MPIARELLREDSGMAEGSFAALFPPSLVLRVVKLLEPICGVVSGQISIGPKEPREKRVFAAFSGAVHGICACQP